jgi:hypothetical protein
MALFARLFGRRETALNDVLPVEPLRPTSTNPPLTAGPTRATLQGLNWRNHGQPASREAPAPVHDLAETSGMPLAAQPVRAALRGLNWDNRAPRSQVTTAAGAVPAPAASTAAPVVHTVDDVLNQFAWD